MTSETHILAWTMDNAKDRLKDIISKGVVIDIFHAEEALTLNDLIGQEADNINEAKFGAFFGSLQIILSRHLILTMNRIFEKEGGRYKVRSIPEAIKVLREHADELTIEQKQVVIAMLCDSGFDPEQLANVSDPDFTRILVAHFEQTAPRSCLKESEGLSRALDALKTLRDKFVAHPEAVKPAELPKTTFHEINQLLGFAKFFVSTVGLAYLGMSYADSSGRYHLCVDAGRASRCLKRLLQAAGGVEKPKYS